MKKPDEKAMRAASNELFDRLKKVIFEYSQGAEKEGRSPFFVAEVLYCALGSCLVFSIGHTRKEDGWDYTLDKVIANLKITMEQFRKNFSQK